MKKIYHLSTCSTNKRIIKELGDLSDFELQDIKTNNITAEQLDQMKEMSGSYESLFSRRSRKYRELGLKDRTLEEADYRRYLLEEYTFLKRPVIIIGEQIFVGYSKKVIAGAKEAMSD